MYPTYLNKTIHNLLNIIRWKVGEFPFMFMCSLKAVVNICQYLSHPIKKLSEKWIFNLIISEILKIFKSKQNIINLIWSVLNKRFTTKSCCLTFSQFCLDWSEIFCKICSRSWYKCCPELNCQIFKLLGTSPKTITQLENHSWHHEMQKLAQLSPIYISIFLSIMKTHIPLVSYSPVKFCANLMQNINIFGG